MKKPKTFEEYKTWCREFLEIDFDDDTSRTRYETNLNIAYLTAENHVFFKTLEKKLEEWSEAQFSIGFDLENETFMHLGKANIPKTVIVLSSVFSHEEILNNQIMLSSHNAAQILIKRLNKLISAFVEYQIPIMVIDEVTRDELVTVFQRINTTGITLSEEEISRARGKDDKSSLE
jgi:hypothetical protein